MYCWTYKFRHYNDSRLFWSVILMQFVQRKDLCGLTDQLIAWPAIFYSRMNLMICLLVFFIFCCFGQERPTCLGRESEREREKAATFLPFRMEQLRRNHFSIKPFTTNTLLMTTAKGSHSTLMMFVHIANIAYRRTYSCVYSHTSDWDFFFLPLIRISALLLIVDY